MEEKKNEKACAVCNIVGRHPNGSNCPTIKRRKKEDWKYKYSYV